MAPNFSKNCILKGAVDCFCVICEEYLPTTALVEKHVTKIDHITHIKRVKNVFGKMDSIIKVNQGYFCQLCNKLFPVLAKVRIHIVEPLHVENKLSCVIKRIGKYIVAFDEMVIKDECWNGISENSCVICNTEFDVESLHKHFSGHVINLIQMKVEFDEEKNIYRKIDETSFQCMICNSVENLSCINKHFNSDEHKALHKSLHILYNDLIKGKCQTSSNSNVQNEIVFSINITGTVTPANDNPKTYERTKETKKDNITPGIARTGLYVDLPKEILKPSQSSKTDKEANAAALPAYNIVYNENAEQIILNKLKANDYITTNGNYCCILCDWRLTENQVPFHKFKRHHQKLLKMHKQRAGQLKSKYPDPNETMAMRDMSKAKIIDEMPMIEGNDIKIDLDNDKAFCKQCSVDLEFTHSKIMGHIFEKHNKPAAEKKSPESNNTTEDDTEFGLAQASTSSASRDPDCTFRDCVSPRVSRDIDQIQKIPAKFFIEDYAGIEYFMYKDIVINNKYCINYYSFCFVAGASNSMTAMCFACESNVSMESFEPHILTPEHEEICREACIIQSDSEFIREIHPGKYHCGFCNHFEPSWEEIETHLQSPSHKETKTNSFWRLQQYQFELNKGSYEKLKTTELTMAAITKKFSGH